MHQVGYLPGISAGCTDNKTLNIPFCFVFLQYFEIYLEFFTTFQNIYLFIPRFLVELCWGNPGIIYPERQFFLIVYIGKILNRRRVVFVMAPGFVVIRPGADFTQVLVNG
jgi:hypothetical protein